MDDLFKAADYPVGTRLILVNGHGEDCPVEVTGHTALPCDLVVRWLGLRPLSALVRGGQSTVCLNQFKEVRYA